MESFVTLDYIPIDEDRIPYRQQMKLDTRTFEMLLDYNSEEDFYTISLWNAAGTMLCSNQPIHYGTPLFEQIRTPEFPLPIIMAYCFDGNPPERITGSPTNFGGKVKLYLFGRVDSQPVEREPGYGYAY